MHPRETSFNTHARPANSRLRLLVALALALCLAAPAQAKTTKSKKSAHTTSAASKKSLAKSASKSKKGSASKKGAQAKHINPNEVALKPTEYPPEISSQIAAYNQQVAEINALRKTDPKMAKARGEILALQKESFDLYATLMAELNGRGEAGQIRKAVAVKGWYKGMPQIAFVVSMGLPDDVETTPPQDGSRLKLTYKTSTFYFEKGRLRAYQMGK